MLAAGRTQAVLLVTALSAAQAAALALGAFATRDLFAALHSHLTLPADALMVLTGAGLIVATAKLAERTSAEWLGQSYANALRSRLYDQFAAMNLSSIRQRRLGGLGLRFVGDLSAARNWIGLGITRLIAAIIVIPAAALTFWLINPSIAPWVVMPITVTALLTVLMAIRLQQLHTRLRSKRANLAIDMLERAPLAPELDLMGRTNLEQRRLATHGKALMHRAVARRFVTSAQRIMPETGAVLAGPALMIGAHRAGAPAADVAGMLALLGILIIPLRELAGIWDRYCAWRVARVKIESLLASPSRQRRGRGARMATPIRLEQIVANGLRISATLSPGEKVLLKGSVGAGKSTLMAVLAGLETPQAGRISWADNGRPPETMYVHTSSPLLRGSLRRVLTLGVRPRPSDALIEASMHQLGLSDVLRRHGGLDGRIMERGNSLSDLERLRLQLARALLSRAPLLLLDLPATHDPLVTQACRSLLERPKTTVLISGYDIERSYFDRCIDLDLIRDHQGSPIRESTINHQSMSSDGTKQSL